MTETPRKPHYAAAILSPSREDLGPIHIADASDDIDAGNLAMDRGAQWMVANGMERARLQIVKDGKGIRSIPVRDWTGNSCRPTRERRLADVKFTVAVNAQ